MSDYCPLRCSLWRSLSLSLNTHSGDFRVTEDHLFLRNATLHQTTKCWVLSFNVNSVSAVGWTVCVGVGLLSSTVTPAQLWSSLSSDKVKCQRVCTLVSAVLLQIRGVSQWGWRWQTHTHTHTKDVCKSPPHPHTSPETKTVRDVQRSLFHLFIVVCMIVLWLSVVAWCSFLAILHPSILILCPFLLFLCLLLMWLFCVYLCLHGCLCLLLSI